MSKLNFKSFFGGAAGGKKIFCTKIFFLQNKTHRKLRSCLYAFTD